MKQLHFFLRMSCLLVALLLSVCTLRAAEDRKAMVLNDRATVGADDHWIYNDLAKGYAEAKRTGKPMLVVIRCVPCLACRMFDEQVVRREPEIASVMEKFVCVRLVMANGLDLSQFQFDFDLSFTAFFLNADGTIYGRYGTRSDQQDTTRDISMPGFRKAMEAVLDLHKSYPKNKDLFAAKRAPMRFATPLEYPKFKGKYQSTIDYDNAPVQSCIHCHMVGEAERAFIQTQQKELPLKDFYPWPMPRVLGLEMDAKEKAKVVSVEKGSAGEKAGIKAGDNILTAEHQPIISTADIQWVLHNAPDAGKLQMEISRQGKKSTHTIALEQDWRKRSDLAWRVSTWELRRGLLGGMFLQNPTDDELKTANLNMSEMHLIVRHVGEYSPHDFAKKAGFKKNDFLIAFDGINKPLSESQLITYVHEHKKAGEKVAATVLRGGQKVNLELTIPGL